MSTSTDTAAPEAAVHHYVYILKCADGTFYTGWTTDPERRLKAHNSGRGAKYTRSRRPLEIVHLEEFDTKSEALKREAAIKALTREEKQAVIDGENRDIREKTPIN